MAPHPISLKGKQLLTPSRNFMRGLGSLYASAGLNFAIFRVETRIPISWHCPEIRWIYEKAFPQPSALVIHIYNRTSLGRVGSWGLAIGHGAGPPGECALPAPPGLASVCHLRGSALASHSDSLGDGQSPFQTKVARFPEKEKIRFVLGLTCPPAPSKGSLAGSGAPLRG